MKLSRKKFKIEKTYRGWTIYFEKQPLTFAFLTKKEALKTVKYLGG